MDTANIIAIVFGVAGTVLGLRSELRARSELRHSRERQTALARHEIQKLLVATLKLPFVGLESATSRDIQESASLIGDVYEVANVSADSVSAASPQDAHLLSDLMMTVGDLLNVGSRRDSHLSEHEIIVRALWRLYSNAYLLALAFQDRGEHDMRFGDTVRELKQRHDIFRSHALAVTDRLFRELLQDGHRLVASARPKSTTDESSDDDPSQQEAVARRRGGPSS